MKNRGFAMGAALALACAAGSAFAQCANPTVTPGSLTLEAGTTDIGLYGDDVNATISLPFNVNFYGVPYSSVNVASNGFLAFGYAGAPYTNQCMPQNVITGPAILAHWDDFWMAEPGQGIFTTLSGPPGAQKFTIEWRAEYYNDAQPLNMGVVFHEDTGAIDIVYVNMPQGGNSATIGVQDGAGTFTQINCNAGGASSGTSITLSCAPPANPTGVGSASPSVFFQGSSTLLTVTASGAAVPPPSTGITVTGDLSSIGGSAAQAFFDNGTNGDVTPGDMVYSYLATVPTAGPASVPFTVADLEGRSSGGSITLQTLSLTDMGTLPTGTTSTTPADLADDEVRWYRFNVGDVSGAAQTYLDVYTTASNDTEIGVYTSSGALVGNDDDGDDGLLSALSFGATNPARPAHGTGLPFDGRNGDLAPGTYYLALGNFNTNFNPTDFNVVSTGPAGFGEVVNFELGVANDPYLTNSTAAGNVGANILLTIQANPGINPPSASMTVTGDLSSVGGSSTQAFFDNGTNGDVTAGDNIFSYTAAIPHAPAQAPGTYTLAMSVVDDLSRDGVGQIVLTLAAEPTGSCCTAGACSISTAFNCGGGGGAYNGDGTDCGVPSYTIATTTETMATISGVGQIAFTASGCDDCTEVVGLPFTFNHFGNGYNEVRISSNGNLQFGTANSAAYTNDAIPSVGNVDNAVYPLWDDYNPGEQGDVYYHTEGVAPGRKFIVEWNNCTQYTAGGAWPLTSETFQAILHEGSNHVEYRYGSITPVNMSGVDQGFGVDASGGDRTIGVENADGSIAYSHPSATHNGESLMVSFVAAPSSCGNPCGTSDFDGDGDSGTDADIEAFFACLAGNCCATCWHLGADFNADGDSGTDADIESFFRVLAGNPC